MIKGLQLAQPRGVGRRHIDHNEIHPRCERARTVLVVLGSILFRGDLVLADVRAHDCGATGFRRAQLLQMIGRRLSSRIVEAHPVAQAIAFHEAPQSGSIVAGLGFRCDRADFKESESECAQPENGLRVFVHASRQAHSSGNDALADTDEACVRCTCRIWRIEVTDGGAHEGAAW